MTNIDAARKIRALAQRLEILAHKLEHPAHDEDEATRRWRLLFDISDNSRALFNIAKDLAT